MADYIDREKYCNEICRRDQNYCDKQSCPIWKAPSEDVAPVVHARWVDKGWAGDSNWEIDGRGNCWRVLECSHCKGQLCGRPKSLNCPECGAIMEVEQQNESN